VVRPRGVSGESVSARSSPRAHRVSSNPRAGQPRRAHAHYSATTVRSEAHTILRCRSGLVRLDPHPLAASAWQPPAPRSPVTTLRSAHTRTHTQSLHTRTHNATHTHAHANTAVHYTFLESPRSPPPRAASAAADSFSRVVNHRPRCRVAALYRHTRSRRRRRHRRRPLRGQRRR